MSIRVDQALVERGLCESREKAKRAVMAGTVKINEHPARKPSDTVKPDDQLTLLVPEKFVSRGGFKLEHALAHFHISPAGQTAIDLGASTGGFTDCLLQHGATKVFAVDVGQGQLAWKLRRDSRIVVMEKTNARALKPANFPAPADLIVIDCSFISLQKILPAAVALLRPSGKIIALLKPQFEAGKAEVDKGAGVITDPAIHERVQRELEQFVGSFEFPVSGFELKTNATPGLKNSKPETRNSKLVWRGVTESPLLGPAGNKEFLVLIEKTN